MTETKNNKLIDKRKDQEEKRKEIFPILYDPKLFHKVISEVSLKVVGELDTIKAIFLCSCGRLVVGNQIASYNLFVNDESGVGKDYVTDSVLNLWSKKIKFKRTRISPTVFTYWKRLTKKQKEEGLPEWNWDGKIVYLEDISEKVLNSDVFKVMCSSGTSTTIVKDQIAIDIQIHGKPVFVITSAKANPKSELIRRFAIVNLDASVNQTKAIIERQAISAKEGLRIQYDHNLTTALTYLDRYPVKVPFAENLSRVVPDGIIMRTVFPRLIDLIRASCCLYQYQRELDFDGFLIATQQDYEIARDVIMKLTSNPKMVSLTKNQQRILDLMDSLNKDLNYSVSDLEPKITFLGDRQLRRELDNLTDLGFLTKDKEDRDTSKPVMVYHLVEMQKIIIPTWEKLQNLVKSVKLDN